jgi:hypothetical protein
VLPEHIRKVDRAAEELAVQISPVSRLSIRPMAVLVSSKLPYEHSVLLTACTFNDLIVSLFSLDRVKFLRFFSTKRTLYLRSLQSLAHIVSSHAIQESCTLTETLSSAPAAGS